MSIDWAMKLLSKAMLSTLILTISQHFHLRKARDFLVGRPFESFIGPLLPDIRAQKDFLRGPPPGCGAFRLEPVALLYLARPAAVRPPLRDLCLPIFRLTFLATTTSSYYEVYEGQQHQSFFCFQPCLQSSFDQQTCSF